MCVLSHLQQSVKLHLTSSKTIIEQFQYIINLLSTRPGVN